MSAERMTETLVSMTSAYCRIRPRNSAAKSSFMKGTILAGQLSALECSVE